MIYDKDIDILSLIRYKMVDKSLFFSCYGANKNMHYILIEELRSRGVEVNVKEKITILKKMFLEKNT